MNFLTNINSPNVIVGDEDNYLSYWLKRSVKRANKIDAIVSSINANRNSNLCEKRVSSR